MDKIQPSEDAAPKDWQALSRRQSVLIGMLAIAVLGLCWAEEIGFAVIAGVVILVGLIATYSRMKSAFVGFVSLMAFATLLVVILPNFVKIKSHGADVEVKVGLHAIKLAIDRYEADEGRYPADMEILREKEYMPVFPRNEYAGRPHMREVSELGEEEWRLAVEMKDLSVHKDVSQEMMPGNFAYLPQTSFNPDGVPIVTSYRLIGFAKKRVDKMGYVVVNYMLDEDENKHGF